MPDALVAFLFGGLMTVGAVLITTWVVAFSVWIVSLIQKGARNEQ
jgi:hypothetical protein